MKLIGTLGRSTVRTAGTLLLRLVLLASTLLVLTRLLGPTDFGAFAGVAAIAIMAGALATLGTHLVVMRDVSMNSETGAASLRYATTATLLGAVLLFASFLSVALLMLPSSRMPLAAIIAIGIADVAVHPFLQLTSARLLATGKVASSQLLLTLPLGLRLVAALALWWASPAQALASYCFAYALASLAALLLAHLLVRRALPPLREWRMPSRAEWKDAGGYAVLNLTAAGPNELDKALSLRLMPADGTGIYATASRVVGALVLPVTALMLSSLPRLFAGHDARDRMLVPTIFIASTGYGLVAGIAVFFASGAIARLFGAGYEALEQALTLLAMAVPGMSMRLAATSTLMAKGQPWTRAWVECLGLTMLCVIAVVLSQPAPDAALPIALAASEWFMALTAWIIVARLPPSRGTQPAAALG